MSMFDSSYFQQILVLLPEKKYVKNLILRIDIFQRCKFNVDTKENMHVYIKPDNVNETTVNFLSYLYQNR